MATTNGAPPRNARDVGRHLRGVAQGRNAERNHDEAARGPQPAAVDLFDLVGDELRSGVQRRAPRDRAP